MARRNRRARSAQSQGLRDRALHALGAKPKYDPLPVFDEILQKQDLKALPPYMTSFFPLAYLCYSQPIPKKLDAAIRVRPQLLEFLKQDAAANAPIKETLTRMQQLAGGLA